MMPKKREQKFDYYGPLTKMAEADGWVMVRRPRAQPFCIPLKNWMALDGEPQEDQPAGYVYPRLLHVEPGTFRIEKILHRHFAGLRTTGEWFRKAPKKKIAPPERGDKLGEE